MCGRTAQTRRAIALAAKALGVNTDEALLEEKNSPPQRDDDKDAQDPPHSEADEDLRHTQAWQDNFNLSPGMDAVVFYKDEDGKLRMDRKKWGLVNQRGTASNPLPHGMNKHFEGLMFNARSDTLYQKPSFGRLTAMKRSCVVAVDGYFEWKAHPVGSKAKKQPYFVRRRRDFGLPQAGEKPYLLLAGLYNKVPTGWDSEPSLETFTIITTEACKPIEWLHSRMPMCVWDERLALAWLSEPTEELCRTIDRGARQTPDGALDAYPVTKEMSSLKFRSEDSIKRLPKEPSVADFFVPMSAEAKQAAQTKKKHGGSTDTTPSQPSMSDQRFDRTELQSKIQEYQVFLRTTLRPQLEIAEAAKTRVEEEVKEYEDLQSRLAHLPEEARRQPSTTVDLGWQKAYCEAKIDPDAKVCVDVGMGFHVELTPSEATDFCRKRLRLLQGKLAHRKAEYSRVQDHVSTAQGILDQLDIKRKGVTPTSSSPSKRKHLAAPKNNTRIDSFFKPKR